MISWEGTDDSNEAYFPMRSHTRHSW
jgi:hypothetical protein